MDTLKIGAILRAVEKKSLSKAAEEFSYTPSALSHIADSLEKELGVKLLKRTHAGVEWTEEGEKLLPKLKAMVKAERELIGAAQALTDDKAQTLRIAAYSSISLHVLPEIVKAFKFSHLSVKVSISVENQLTNALLDDAADVVFSDSPAAGESVWHELLKDPFVAVVPAALFPKEKSVRLDRLYDYPYISTSESLLKEYFDERNFREVIRFASVDDNSVLSMVKEELGVAILPALTAKKKVKGVRVLRLTPEFHRIIGYSHLKAPSAAALEFIRFLQKQK